MLAVDFKCAVMRALEISEILKMPERTVEYHITQALRLMREHLKDYMVYVLLLYFSLI
ncbi:MAG: hypothetical protein WC756_22260 [Taibaiella sp.]|jgi:RNA polymerase sigma-70 factor (ECF subfamily)